MCKSKSKLFHTLYVLYSRLSNNTHCGILILSLYFCVLDHVAHARYPLEDILRLHLDRFSGALSLFLRPSLAPLNDDSSRNVISLNLRKRLRAISENLKIRSDFDVERHRGSVE